MSLDVPSSPFTCGVARVSIGSVVCFGTPFFFSLAFLFSSQKITV